MFTYHHRIQLHHTDAYSIIFFANQLQFCHDAFQAMLAHLGFPLPMTRQEVASMLVIVHVESDYQVPVHVGDELVIELRVKKIGTTSLMMNYTLINQYRKQVGTAQTVHVNIDTKTSVKVPLSDGMRRAFTPHLA
jgi:1,4-dihydroxy-2-naphthoyl-CoA hydrolase